VDAQVIQPLLQTQPSHMSLVLCGDHVAHVYEAMVPSWWQSLMQKFKTMSMNQVIGVSS
jgi:hypothetical protein